MTHPTSSTQAFLAARDQFAIVVLKDQTVCLNIGDDRQVGTVLRGILEIGMIGARSLAATRVGLDERGNAALLKAARTIVVAFLHASPRRGRDELPGAGYHRGPDADADRARMAGT